MNEGCEHLEEAARNPNSGKVRTGGCEECLATGGSWVQLRECLECGHVGCCDSSPGKHATEHFHRTQHPVMKSFEPGADWAWCYVDEAMMRPFAEGTRGEDLHAPA